MSKTFTLSVEGFEGLDQRAGCSTTIKSFTELRNFKIEHGGLIKKRNGYKKLETPDSFGGNLLWADKGFVLMGREREVYRLYENSFLKIGEASGKLSAFFGFGDSAYALGEELYRIKGSSLETVNGYVPLIATACAPGGAGTAYESPNMLTPKRRVRYNGDGIACTYMLPEKNLTSLDYISVNGTKLTANFEFDPINGCVNLGDPPPDGINNVEICYSARKNVKADRMIRGCRFGLVFENRLFLYGNPDYPNYLFRSTLADGLPTAEYFTETDYHVFETALKSLCGCYSRLIMFFKDSALYTHSQLRTDSLGNSYTSFPLYELSDLKGGITEGNCISYNNMPVTLCEDGLNRWVSTEIADERAATVFSQRVFRHVSGLLSHPVELRMLNRKGGTELWFAARDGVLIYNYGLDCFYFYGLPRILGLCEVERDVMFCNSEGVYLFTEEEVTDAGEVIEATFTTPYCTFGAPYELKDLWGLSFTVNGKDSFEAQLEISRGNISEKQSLMARLALPALTEEGCRRKRERLHLKRFYSCRLTLTTCADNAVISDFHLFGEVRGGGLRNN